MEGEYDSTVTADNTEKTGSITRRDALKAAGATAAGAALSGCLFGEDGKTLEVNIQLEEAMHWLGEQKRGDPLHAARVASAVNEVDGHLPKLVDASDEYTDYDVTIFEEPAKLKFDQLPASVPGGIAHVQPPAVLRLLEWDSRIGEDPEFGGECNMLIGATYVPDPAAGIALLDPRSAVDGLGTRSSFTGYGQELLNLDWTTPEDVPASAPIMENGELTANATAYNIAMASAHEPGHNLRRHHNEGTLTVDEDEGTAYSSTMLGPYIFSPMFEAWHQACTLDQYPRIDPEETDVHWRYEFSDCVARQFAHDATRDAQEDEYREHGHGNAHAAERAAGIDLSTAMERLDASEDSYMDMGTSEAEQSYAEFVESVYDEAKKRDDLEIMDLRELGVFGEQFLAHASDLETEYV